MEHTNAEQTQQCEVVEEAVLHVPDHIRDKSYDEFLACCLHNGIDHTQYKKAMVYTDSIENMHHINITHRPLSVNHPDYMRLVVHEMD